MSDTRATGRSSRVIFAVFGLLVAGIGFGADLLTGGGSPGLGPTQIAVVAAGLLCCSFALWARSIRPVFGNVVLVAVAVLTLLLALEGVVRLLEIDLARDRAAFEAMPIWFRQPTVPVGEIYFRRPGPAQWTGRVLTEYLEAYVGISAAYPEEEPLTISYDALGFRNPPELTEWEVVVVGDSFVELGHLPYEQLFTTELGARLGKKVKNLGVSATGPLTHIFYLREYGKSRGTADAVLVFYEGNDLAELEGENRSLQRFRRTGQRDYREVPNGASLFRAIVKLAASFKPTGVVHGAYLSSVGVPVSIGDVPPAAADLDEEQLRLLRATMARWSATAMELELTPWLIYMPSKRRVFHGHLEFDDSVPVSVRDWQPTDLPDLIEDLARTNGIRFIDATPALARETAQGRLAYNAIWDTHLNRLGSRVVAEVIADEMLKR